MKKKCLLTGLSSLMVLGACQGEIPGETPLSSSSDEPVTLSEAIENTKSNYALSIASSADYEIVFSVVAEDFYYYAPSGIGYAVLDDDPGFYHGFDLAADESSDSSYDYIMTMYGRYAVSSNRDIYAYDFLEILAAYADDFSQISEDTYACSVTDLATEVRNFFQNRNYGYTNYFEVTVKDGRVHSFTPYEKSLDESYAYSTFLFSNFDKEEYAPYKAWKEGGAKVDLRIFDLKQGYQSSVMNYSLLYEGAEVEISGHVAGFDYEGAFYLTNLDDSTGNVGIRVETEAGVDSPELGDVLSVKGTVSRNGYVAYLKEAAYEVMGHEDHFPYFDEEAISKVYGGGYYAAYIFSQTPVYGDSVYSTYAYVETLPEAIETDKDTQIGLICPSQKDGDTIYRMRLLLPKEMAEGEKEAALESLRSFGKYGEADAKEVYLERFITRFNPSYDYLIELECGPDSRISPSLSAGEKIKEAFGVTVPLISSDEYACFKFGASTGYLLEPYYGLEGASTSGIYYYDAGITASEWESEQSSLADAGFSLLDKVKDVYGSKHCLYSNGTVTIDILLYENASYAGEDEYAIYMWIYQGETLRSPSIKEILQEKIPYFDADDFLIDGLFDADFAYYALPNYAGNVYEEGDYLSCVTMDVQNGDSYLLELTRKYIAIGYSLLREEDEKTMRRYVTRGSSHYILYKAIEGSMENVYLDLAIYATDDYTYLGHDEWKNRVEILIYKGTEPLTPKLGDDLTNLSAFVKDHYGVDVSFSFSGDVSVEEYYEVAGGNAYIDYGYYFVYNCFVYASSVATTLSDIRKSLLDSGYALSSTTSKGNECYKNGSSYIFVMPREEDGYIRLIDGVGGTNF